MILEFIKKLYEKAKPHCQGKYFIWRLIILLFCLYSLFCEIFDIEYMNIIWGLNLGIHELGHFVFMIMGSQFWHVAGGTIFQLGIPIISLFMFYKQKDFFAIGFGLYWLATNIFYVSWYIGSLGEDSFNAIIPFGALRGGNVEVIHDWDYLLKFFGLVEFYRPISLFVEFIAVVVMIGGIAWMIAILRLIKKVPKKDTISRESDLQILLDKIKKKD